MEGKKINFNYIISSDQLNDNLYFIQFSFLASFLKFLICPVRDYVFIEKSVTKK